MNFYPRSPCGERPAKFRWTRCPAGFLSTLSLRRATCLHPLPQRPPGISIHALLAESDRGATMAQNLNILFLSTFSLRRATRDPRPQTGMLLFLSTLSLRRATTGQTIQCAHRHNFYPRSPCGERRGLSAETPCMSYFYPRSPCGERPKHLT